MEDCLQIGVITSTHGLKGEVKIFPTTDPERFDYLETCLVDTGRGEKRPLTVEGLRPFKNQFIVKFEGLDKIEDVEKYKGASLWVSREEAQDLEENEYYIADLIGMEVFLEDGSSFGRLKDVMETGANDVYIVDRPGKGEALIPAISQCILSVDVEEGKMVIHLLEGLVE
ncbi:MAG: 16S rRNA processing protein RimM [Blautia sp.]|nr:16S rRNA processing protein RimM [Blautia sp.]